MTLAARREHFYAQLATLLSAGMPVRAAVAHLQKQTSGPLAGLALGMQEGLEAGSPLAEAMQGHAELLEVAVIAAAERGGKMELGAQYLARYYGLLAQVWKQWRAAMAYPLLVLHAAIFLPAVTMLVGESMSFWKVVGVPLCSVYLLGGLGYFLSKILLERATTHETTDALLSAIPFLGAFRRDLALARFCQALEIQLQAGGNVSEAVKTAGNAAATARLKHAANRMAQEIATHGCALGPLLLTTPTVPPTLAQSLNTAETVGRLDEECGTQAQALMEKAGNSATLCGIWIPKFLYALIAVYAISKIFSFYTGSLQGMDGQMSELLR